MIRRATPTDAGEAGRIHAAARDEMRYLPRIPDEDRPKLGSLFFDRFEMWVAERDERIVAYMCLRDDMLEHLYVSPSSQNKGIGSAMLDRAKRERPNGLRLWVFQRNTDARRFYERHGFLLIEQTDGAANMEREPDALYEWRPISAS